jgi:type I restriction enzyme, S subunit
MNCESGMVKVNIVRLGDVAVIDRTLLGPSEIQPSQICLGLEDIDSDDGSVTIKGTRERPKSTKFQFSEDHILYGKLRPYLKKVARPAMDGVCSTDILPIRPSKKLDRNYLFHFLRTPDFTAKATQAAVGVNLPRLSPSLLSTFDIPLPPLSEQKRIAAILDKADDLRAKRRAAIAELDSLTQAIFLEMFGDPVTNPKGWPFKNINQTCDLIVDCVNRTAPVVDYPTPYKMIRTTNVKNGEVDLSETRYVTKDTFNIWNRRATPQSGDVLLTREAPVGEAGILRSSETVFLGQRLMLYRVNGHLLIPEYLLYSFRGGFLQNQFNKHGSGSTVKHLPLPICRSFKLLVPPISLQEEFSRQIKAIEQLKIINNANNSALDSLFSSLQQQAFSGEL